LGVFGGENLFFAVFCIFLHFFAKTHQNFAKVGGFLTAFIRRLELAGTMFLEPLITLIFTNFLSTDFADFH